MKKILIVSTVSRQFYLFEQSNIKALRALNFEVHGAANFEDRSERLKEVNVIEHHIDIQRSPFSLKNIKAIKQLEQLVKKEKFDVIHCHAPVGGVLGRLVGKKFPNCKVIYTAHGFHFFRGAPLKNWLLFYPIEKFLSKYTDHLITINNEDYKLAKEKFNMKNLHHINGIGVDLAKFQAIMKEDKYNLRQSIGFSRTDKILIYVGELSYRKNQTVLINAMETVVKQFPEVKLLIVGKGILMEEYRQLIKEKNMTDTVKLLGFRNDIPELMQISDLAVSSSKQEGLPVNLMEAMATGLPLIVSNCRGNRDLAIDNQNGYIIGDLNNSDEFASKIMKLIENDKLMSEFSSNSLDLVNQCSQEFIISNMKKIYGDI
ncbi:glycosyltransferase family 4 protein [Streptococcus parauberis]|uniref:Glycosyltransferase, group 1 family protein n=1 Tax=Streptococcus parauberis NCFD 2020 TaxID=873447 RepID=F1Z118_9STRE|nr:glycosyltransferase family 4 protein [Streptococcus parauberis]EGE53971.1 glycosyltransferase, group 1 family protein [Streptococcus parauberis NCFD 2020]